MKTADTNTSHGKIASSQVTKKRLDGPAGTLAWRGALISVVSRQWRPSTSFCRQRKQRKEKRSQCRWRRHHPSVWWCGCNHRSIHTHTHTQKGARVYLTNRIEVEKGGIYLYFWLFCHISKKAKSPWKWERKEKKRKEYDFEKKDGVQRTQWKNHDRV